MSYVLLQYISCLTVKTKTYLLILQYTIYTTGKYVLYMGSHKGGSVPGWGTKGQAVLCHKKREPLLTFVTRGAPVHLWEKGSGQRKKKEKKKRRDEPEKGSGVERGAQPRASHDAMSRRVTSQA